MKKLFPWDMFKKLFEIDVTFLSLLVANSLLFWFLPFQNSWGPQSMTIQQVFDSFLNFDFWDLCFCDMQLFFQLFDRSLLMPWV